MKTGQGEGVWVKRLLKAGARCLAQPALVRRALLMRRDGGSLRRRLDYDAVAHPELAYGVYYAALLARTLGLTRYSVIEFGVGEGTSLRAIESLAEETTRELGVEIQVFGFDYRRAKKDEPMARAPELPRFSREALGKRMPIRKVQETVRFARLLPGEYEVSIPRFLFRHYPAPIGFMNVAGLGYSDLSAALTLVEATTDFLLPRVLVNMGDVVGGDLDMHCEYAGPLAAVRAFNDSHRERKVAPIRGLESKRLIPAWWNQNMYAAHILDHARYCSSGEPERSPVVVRPNAERVVAASQNPL